MIHVLLIEDDRRVADFIQRGLRAEGMTVTHAASGELGLELALAGSFSLILLDLMLPVLSGRDICQQLRARGVATPILMLTAQDGRDDVVGGLRLGADDYMVKPFDFDELLARIEALHRRPAEMRSAEAVLECGPLRFDPVTQEATLRGERLELTGKERAILALLLSHPGRVYSRERILNAIWGANEDPLTNVVEVYIARLRRKFGADAEMIGTLRGAGYRLRIGGS